MLVAGQQAILGWGRGGEARPPPLARPGRVSCGCLRLHPAIRPSHRLAPGPCRCDIRTSCASQMFLVYPQMCVASSQLPWPPSPHHGVGPGPGAL